MSRRAKAVACLLGGMWIGVIALGTIRMARYANAAGPPLAREDTWPEGTGLVRGSAGFTIVVFAHPECPCTLATLEELARIVARKAAPLRVYTVFSSSVDDHARSLEQARAIPGVELVRDPPGREARLFGARTSGQLLLYAADGRLLFHGGITGTRGEAGDNFGQEAVLAYVRGGSSGLKTAPVFGCRLTQEEKQP